MSTVLSCQDLSFVGGQRYDCPYSASTSADPSVDVSTETLVSLWDAGPLDNAACQQYEPRRETHVSDHGAVPERTWSDQLSPQLQRNKQLQDTLMQREEELARLHEENNQLKEFLNSSFVKSLEEKNKKLLSGPRADGQRQRKRSLQGDGGGGGDFQSFGTLLLGGEGKRTCRNLSLEFCSAEELASDPPLDTWILETLGLKDEDTIDPDGCYGSPVGDAPPPGVGSPAHAVTRYSPGVVRPAGRYSPATLDHTATYSPSADKTCDYSTIVESSDSYGHSMDMSSGYSTSQSSASDFSTIDPSHLYSATLATPQLPRLVGSLPTPDSSNRLAPVAASTPHRSHLRGLQAGGSPSAVGGGRALYSTPRGRTELAFSMSLSPRHSVRTHSFPQGQAFIRKDAQGGWNFTWVPKQCS